MKKYIFLLFAILLVPSLLAQNRDADAYFSLQQMPDASLFLPPPPDTASLLFADDMGQWLWGKSQRNTQRGSQASLESLYGVYRMCQIFSEAIGITLSSEATPAIYHLLLRVSATAEHTITNAKAKYMRKRPFVRMNEHVAGQYDDEASLRGNGSYPSGHTTLGWSTALALAQVAPEVQDTILRRGWEYGESRVIVGAHWQSDVDAARLAASAGVARILGDPRYKADLEAARAEFLRLWNAKPHRHSAGNASQPAGFANSLRILPHPIDTAHRRFQGEVLSHWVAKGLRTTPRGAQAIADNDKSLAAYLSALSLCLSVRLDTSTTPNMARYIQYVASAMGRENRRVKDTLFRKRPYVQLGEASLIPADEERERTDSSYPSGHSAMGWGVALATVQLTEVAMNRVLQWGYEYGYSRVVAGYHWASDVQDARLIAAYTLVRLQSEPEFQRLFAAAQSELNALLRQ